MKVKIKTWKRMEEEFGLDRSGSIDCEESFVNSMENRMPKNRIIEVDEDSRWKHKDGSTWMVSKDMIAEVIEL